MYCRDTRAMKLSYGTGPGLSQLRCSKHFEKRKVAESMAKQKPPVNQDTYEREFAPLLRALAEKARILNCSCLAVVEVEGTIHLSGNIIGTSSKMLAAYEILFEEEEEKTT